MRNAHTLCWWAGFALTTIMSIVLWIQLSSFPFPEEPTPWVLGFVVLIKPQFDIPLIFVGLGLILMVISMALRIRTNALQDHAVLTRTVSVLVVLFTLLPWAIVNDSTSHLLKPPSDSGTRVLVVNHIYFMRAEGDVYTVKRGAVIPQHIGFYTEPDGYNPIASNTYALSWQGETPQLTLYATGWQQVTYFPDDAKGTE